jgi:hypothetical protein
MRRPVAAVEARRSRSPSVADDVALMEVPGRKKRGVPNPWPVPTEESYAGSHQGNFWKAGPDCEPRSNRVFDLADLSIKLANVIFSIIPPLAALAFVAGQRIMMLLLDVRIPAYGLEIVPP